MNRSLPTPQVGAVPGCFRCPDNDLLAFARLTSPGLLGYVMPGSFQHTLNGRKLLVPMPYIYVITTNDHCQADELGGIWPDGWTTHERELLRLVGVNNRGYNLIENHGEEHGERPVGASTDHPFKWLVPARGRFTEVPAENRVLGGTRNLGFATAILRSRQHIGSLPPDEVLAQWWLECSMAFGDTVEAWQTYNDRTLVWAPSVRLAD